MMASLTETHCCRTHIPACSAVGGDSPSLLELQLLPAKEEKHYIYFLGDLINRLEVYPQLKGK